VFRVASPIGVASIFLLDPAGIGEHQLAQVSSTRGANHAAAKALGDEPGQVANVVEMRVGEDNGINRGGRDWKFLPVPQTQLFQALKEPAIDEHATPVLFEEVL
jgi:hypothetical protein